MNPLEVIKEASKTAVDVAGHAIKTGNLFCSKEKSDERMKICSVCPDYIIQSDKCCKCGCFMQRKTQLEAAKCPINKW